jgi:hypothetical protein
MYLTQIPDQPDLNGMQWNQEPSQRGTRDELNGPPLLVLRNTPLCSMSKNIEPSGLSEAFSPHRSQ